MTKSGKILVAILLLIAIQQVAAWETECDRIAHQGDKSCNSPTEICDPCYKLQWHLKNTDGEPDSVQYRPSAGAGKDINVEPVWKKGNLGQGIVIGIIDDQIFDHEDLRENMLKKYNHNYGSPTGKSSHAATVAGVAVARANHIGLRGVAPLASFYVLGVFTNYSYKDRNITDATARHAPITAVANNSFAKFYSLFYTYGGRAWERAVETGISKGFYGKGTVYVFGAGNSRCRHSWNGRMNSQCGVSSTNYRGNQNHHAVITVGAVNDLDKVAYISERGANLWLCAPVGGDSHPAEYPRPAGWTTHTGYYRNNVFKSKGYIALDGTSGAAPIVSGVVALMRHANPNLTWRDVKLILANSARRNNPTDAGWQAGAMKHGALTERYYFNRKCGFGVVDANAAVSLAEQWVNLPPRVADTTSKTRVSTQSGQTIRSNLSIQSDIDFIEYVDIPITLGTSLPRGNHPFWDERWARWYELDVKLVSPSATTSTLIISHPNMRRMRWHFAYAHFDASLDGGAWRFGSAKHLGEDPSGTWQLVIDKNGVDHLSLAEWELRIRGYKVTMDAVASSRPLVEGDIREDATNSPISLSLAGAHWRPNLQANEFKLIGAAPGLRVAAVTTATVPHIVQLTLALGGEGFVDDHQFQIEASTGTVANLNRAVLSDKVEILSNKPAVGEAVLAADGAVGSPYRFTIPANAFKSAEALTYEISGEAIPWLSINPVTSEISGTPTMTGTYRPTITATTQDGYSAMTSFTLRVRPSEHPIVVKQMHDYVMRSNKRDFKRDGITINLNLNEIFADSEPNPTTLSYTVSGYPDWLNYNSEMSMISGTTTSTSARGVYEITIIATDEDNNPTEISFGVRVAVGLHIRAKVFLESRLLEQ